MFKHITKCVNCYFACAIIAHLLDTQWDYQAREGEVAAAGGSIFASAGPVIPVAVKKAIVDSDRVFGEAVDVISDVEFRVNDVISEDPEEGAGDGAVRSEEEPPAEEHTVSSSVFSILGAAEADPTTETSPTESAIRSVQQGWLRVILPDNFSGRLQTLGVDVNNVAGCKTLVAAVRRRRYEEYARTSAMRKGPGEQGSLVDLDLDELSLAEEHRAHFGYHKVVSDKVALDRSLPDFRDPQCGDVDHVSLDDLPKTSVIVVFRDEPWSLLLRTLHSIINRTPPDLLHEVILVEDSSSPDFPSETLRQLIGDTWPDGIIQYMRTPTPVGPVRGRLLGAVHATGEALVFVDSAVEVTRGWLEPLLARLRSANSSVAVPSHDYIDPMSFQYVQNDPFHKGVFRWDMKPVFAVASELTLMDPTEPIPSPTLVGSVFAVTRAQFLLHGGLDHAYEDLPLAQVELGFRTWMCGGSVAVVPCSRVAQLLRPKRTSPHAGEKNNHDGDQIGRDAQRLAETWLGAYRKYFYLMRPDRKAKPVDDVDERMTFHISEGCRDFQWYIKKVFPDKFIWDQKTKGWGQLMNEQLGACVDTRGVNENVEFQAELWPCAATDSGLTTQIFALDEYSRLRREYNCLGYYSKEPGLGVISRPHCSEQGELKWVYKQDTKEIVHALTRMCLDARRVEGQAFVVVNRCTGVETQKWKWEHYSEPALTPHVILKEL